MAAAYPNYPPYEHYYSQGAPPPPPPPQQPPAQAQGYPPAPQPNAYPTSPHGQQPARPHTTAPYAAHQFAPPPGGQPAYYGHGYQQPAPASAPAPAPAPAPPAPAPPAPAPVAGEQNTSPYGQPGLQPSQQEIESVLRWMQMSRNPAPAGGPPPPAPVPPGDAPAPPRTSPPSNSAMPPPPVPQPPQHGGYPFPSHPASHPGGGNPGPSPRTPGPHLQMPGAYDFGVPASAVPGPPQPSKTPVSSHRPESRRKASEYSETSAGYGSGTSSAATWKESMTSGSIGNSVIYEQWGGNLVDFDPQSNREPKPKPKLRALFRELANYLINEMEPKGSIVVTVTKLLIFYDHFALPDDPMNWKSFFPNRKPKTLSRFFTALNVEHFLVPPKDSAEPTIPALTPTGFETWMFTQLMAHPKTETQRIQRIIHDYQIMDPLSHKPFPRYMAPECLPQTADQIIRTGLHEARESYPHDMGSYANSEVLDSGDEDDDDEDDTPLALPAGPSGGGGRRPPLGSRDSEDIQMPSLMRRRTSRPYASTNIPADINPTDYLTAEEKSSPTLERPRQPYSTKNPNWGKEDLNPRPNLGEDSRHHGSTGGHSVHSSKPMGRSRSVRKTVPSARERSRPPPPDRRHERRKSMHRNEPSWSGESGGHGDAEEALRRKVEGLELNRGRSVPPAPQPSDEGYYVGDGLYEDDMHPHATPAPAPVAHRAHGHSQSAHHRARSRGPPRSEKNVKDYIYQDAYYAGAPGGGGGDGGIPPSLGGTAGTSRSDQDAMRRKRRSTGVHPSYSSGRYV